MLKRLIRLLTNLTITAVILGGVFVSVLLVGMRTQNPHILSAVKRMNRSVSNPAQLKTAGTPGAFAAVLHHVGRSSGRAYRTPVGITESDGEFVIALPYGANADWVLNVLRAGDAEITFEGSDYLASRPEIVPTATMADRLPASELRTLTLFGVRHCLVFRRVEPTS